MLSTTILSFRSLYKRNYSFKKTSLLLLSPLEECENVVRKVLEEKFPGFLLLLLLLPKFLSFNFIIITNNYYYLSIL